MTHKNFCFYLPNLEKYTSYTNSPSFVCTADILITLVEQYLLDSCNYGKYVLFLGLKRFI